MKRYKISIFGGGEQSSVVMDLRPTELKTIERVSALFEAGLVGLYGEPWMDVEEV